MTRRRAAALSTLLPTTDQTLLLRACLDEAPGAVAWRSLRRRLGTDGVEALLTRNRRLLTLLHRADARLNLSAELRRRLVAVTLREKQRSSAFVANTEDVLRRLVGSGFDVLVLRGAALAELAYPEPFLRHCHDLDLLLHGGPVPDEDLARRASLHRFAFAHPRARADDGPLWARRKSFAVRGAEGWVMAPSDMLVHVCGQAFFSPSRHTLSWVTDAWFTLASWPHLDWELVISSAQERHLGVALALLLGYLRNELGAPVPAEVVRRLEQLAVESVDRDIAMALAWSAARRRAPSRIKALLSAGAGVPSLLLWRLKPSSAAEVVGVLR